MVEDYGRRNRRRLLRILVVAALVISGAIYVATRSSPPVCAAPLPSHQAGAVGAFWRGQPLQDWEALVVRDGDTVTASGKVAAEPCEPVRFCHPWAGEPTTDPARCDYGLRVLGVDMDALGKPTTSGFVRIGYATLRGRLHDGVLTVSGQEPWRGEKLSPYGAPPMPPPQPPCAPPPEGWIFRPGPPDTRGLRDHLERHPGRFGPPWTARPEGYSIDSSLPERRYAPVVVVIEVLDGDVDRARVELSMVFPGNLCVVADEDVERPYGTLLWQDHTMYERLTPLLDGHRDVVLSVGNDGQTGRGTLDLLMLTEDLYRVIDVRFDRDELTVETWLKPLR